MTDAPDGPGHEIARQDEILELLYWMEGERLADSATLPGLTRFLGQRESDVARTLTTLVARAYVTSADGRFRLTELGRREGARRFADEFAPLLSHGHGECNDPSCDCHTDPATATECHVVRAHGGHAH